MEEFKIGKIYQFLFWIFIFVSAVHIIYAAFTMRGLYCDGAFFLIHQLNFLSENKFQISYDPEHSRFMMMALLQLPVIFAHFLFFVKSKFSLMIIYSFFQFALSVLALLWNFKLTQKTKRVDILFWNVFFYGAIICPYMIFSVVETIIGATLHFILWNYLVSNIDYKKRDIVYILILLAIMFGTYEYVAYLGIIFFIAHFHYVLKDNSVKNQAVKTLIGFGALGAAVFNIWVIFKTPGEDSEIMRFIGETIQLYPRLLEINSLFSIAAIVLIIPLFFCKKKINAPVTALFIIIFTAIFIKLFLTKELSVYPMWEQHMRTLPCIVLPLIFTGLYIKDVISDKINFVKYYNLICISLILCIFQTSWQTINTYYWNENIKYMKKELANTEDLLYIPSEHEEISSFHNRKLRRYIWHGVYAATSILFSDTYEQKTLLLNYDEQQDPGNGNYRDRLFVFSSEPEHKNKMMIPVGAEINIKNKYWDLTECARALDEYNKKHNIKTLE